MMDHRCLSMHERCRRRGSLPLKKRRLSLLPEEHNAGNNSVGATAGFGAVPLERSVSSSGPAGNLTILSSQTESLLPRLPLFAEDPRGGGDEKLAALALLSAARGLDYSYLPLLLPPVGGSRSSSANAPDALAPGCQHHLKPLSSRSDSLQSSESYSTAGGFSSEDADSHSNAVDMGHYLPQSVGEIHKKRGALGANDSSSSPKSTKLSAPRAAQPQQQSQQQQDKRFTGAAGEVCCRATTTRGRPCTFVAADGSTFCHLHSPSKPLPPYLPRRDSDCYYSDKLLQSPPPPPHSAPEAAPLNSTDALLPFVSPGAASSSSSSSTSGPRRPASSSSGGTSKRRAKYADSPHPLLSKVPVDRWFGTRVRIACGPLEGKVGIVEKWGNGWITVRVPDIGPHNRRSFELYVLADDEEGNDAEEGPKPSSAAAPPRVAPSRGSKSPSLLLRSTVSPSPSSDSSSIKGPSIVHKVSYSYDGEEASSSSSRGTDPPLTAVVIDTPQQAVRTVCSASRGGGGDASSLSGESTSAADLAVPKVTPVTPKAARTELPLAESLVLAREGGAKKYRLDMLFGTAALERGRRSIHRPARYDDDDHDVSPSGGGGHTSTVTNGNHKK